MTRRKRIFYSLLLLLLPGGGRKRAEFIRKHKIYGSVGENCSIMKRKIPLYSNLIHLHNNVIIASHVAFNTHDAIHHVLNHCYGRTGYLEKVGCIEIMNNVFIGASVQIMNNVRIGNNVIIGAGSLVNKDIPDNSVFAGVPARYICSFDEYVEKQRRYSEQFREKYGRHGVDGVDDALAAMMYEEFKKQRDTKK